MTISLILVVVGYGIVSLSSLGWALLDYIDKFKEKNDGGF